MKANFFIVIPPDDRCGRRCKAPNVVRQRGLPKMLQWAVDEFYRVAQRSMPSTNAEGAGKPILIFFEVLPAEGTTAGFEFCGRLAD